MNKEVNDIHADVPKENSELGKMEEEIKKLDPNNPDPAVVDDLL